MTINTFQTSGDASTSSINTEQVTDEAQVNKKPETLNDLLTQYGIYGMLAQYDKYLRKGERIKAKKLEDKLYSIEKKVQNDASLPKWMRDRFVEYIEKKEDEIEDRY